MNPLIVAPVLEIGRTLIDRFFPNKEEARKAEAQFLTMAAEGELKQVIAQLEINAREAAHPSVWVAGWRPFFWVVRWWWLFTHCAGGSARLPSR
jgi:sensor domain CHASE-containing protein